MIRTLGIFVIFLVVCASAGEAIGRQPILLAIFIVITMLCSYVAPIVFVIVTKRWFWLVVLPWLASIAFAIPSSIVAYNACKVGDAAAIWVMRAVPAIWIGETVASDKGTSCADF